ncbi:MAG TPA: ribosome maturation factor RimM, partial [Dermacoccus sp.]|nr:ribosome maturation factor RimM [Dermacoccus sp.]
TPPPGLLDLARPDAPDAPDDSAALEATDPAEAN